MVRIIKSKAAWVVFSSVALFACRPADPPPNPLDTTAVSMVIGPDGGELSHPTGAKLVVPAGALAAEVEISITGAAASDSVLAGQAFVLAPYGQWFALPATFEVPIDSGLESGLRSLDAGVENLRLMQYPQNIAMGGDVVELATSVDTARQVLTAQLAHLSKIVPNPMSNPFRFSTSGLPKGTVGTFYNGAFAVSGGRPPYYFTNGSDFRPPWLTMNMWGVFSGLPTKAGSFAYVVRVSDAVNSWAEAVAVIDVVEP